MEKSLLPWSGYLDLLKPAGELIDLTWAPQSEQMRAELYQQLLMNVSLGYFLYFQADPGHPDFSPFLNSVFLLQPNPDDTYYFTPVSGDGVYRIVGERGSVHLLLISTGKAMMGMSDQPGASFANYDADELQIAPDGTFEVILSAERPAGHSGNWWALHPEADYVMARQRSYDWGVERDARLAIERLDAPIAKPRPTAAELDRRMREMLGGFVGRLSAMWLRHQNTLRDRGQVNTMELTSFGGAVKGQSYWQTIFEIGDDEALILETDVPATRRYWNIQVNDGLFNAVDYITRQSSLNGHQAAIDPDGKFRAVLSARDPGVANWLDTGGFSQGTLIGRWYECDSHPVPTLTRVPLAELDRRLPEQTRRLSPAERAATLTARRRGAQLRRRW